LIRETEAGGSIRLDKSSKGNVLFCLEPCVHEIRCATDDGKLMTMGSVSVLRQRTSSPGPTRTWRGSTSCATSTVRIVLFPVEGDTEL